MTGDNHDPTIGRRDFLKWSLALGASLGLSSWGPLLERLRARPAPAMKTRTIPSSGEELPVVGVGTWQQFDVSSEPDNLDPLRKVLSGLFETGGSVIDSSPMYGRAESVVGTLLDSMEDREQAFVATKVWTSGRQDGIQQMEQSMRRLNVSTVDLMQVHNLVDWQTHLDTLDRWKETGRIRYDGITHYRESGFEGLERIMRDRTIDFVQLPYSIGFRGVEETLLPLARDRGIAVLVNRPFQTGTLFDSVRDEPLPDWASDLDCESWAQYFLKFILGHPAVTCVIPGTSNPEHMLDNARAGVGTIPDEDQRERMHRYWRSL